MLSGVCLKLSLNYLSCHIWGYVYYHFSYDDYENACTLSYYHHHIKSITHLPLLRVRSWNNGMHYVFLYSYYEFWTRTCCGGWKLGHSCGAGTSSSSYHKQVEEWAPKPVGWWWPLFWSKSSICVNICILYYGCNLISLNELPKDIAANSCK